MDVDTADPADDAEQFDVALDLCDPQQAWAVTTDFEVRALEESLERTRPTGQRPEP